MYEVRNEKEEIPFNFIIYNVRAQFMASTKKNTLQLHFNKGGKKCSLEEENMLINFNHNEAINALFIP